MKLIIFLTIFSSSIIKMDTRYNKYEDECTVTITKNGGTYSCTAATCSSARSCAVEAALAPK